MKTEKLKRLSDSELDIMRVLWHSNKPLRASEIVKLLFDTRSWKPQTAHVLLNRLCEKGYANADRENYSYRFYPLVTEAEYIASESVLLIKKVGGSVNKMVASLIDTYNITDDDILALSEMLEKKRLEIQDKKRGERND
jgi:BlaI family penicillinase repressor